MKLYKYKICIKFSGTNEFKFTSETDDEEAVYDEAANEFYDDSIMAGDVEIDDIDVEFLESFEEIEENPNQLNIFEGTE